MRLWCRTCGDLTVHLSPKDPPVMHAGKPLALLVYLALAPEGRESRDRLARLFWPGAEDRHAQHSLREARWRIRRAVGASVVETSGPDAVIAVDVSVDCQEAIAAFERSDFEVALSLLRGRFLGGFELSDSREFCEWREAQEAHFDQYRTGATRALIDEALSRGSAGKAIVLAQDWVARDPLLEEPTRTLISILESQGQVTAALARVREYETLLKAATGGEPSHGFCEHAAALEAKLSDVSHSLERLPLRAHALARQIRDPSRVPSPPKPRPVRGITKGWGRPAVAVASVAMLVLASGLVMRSTSSTAAPSTLFKGALYITGTNWRADRAGATRTYRAFFPSGIDDIGAVEPLDGRPADLPPLLLPLPVSDAGQTHSKVFAVHDRDTTQLTFGSTDDGPALWSPDRRWIAVQRGWPVGDGYRFNLFVIDSTGRDISQLTDGNHHDVLLAWSADGTRLAFSRPEGDSRSLWLVDSDGAYRENLGRRFSLSDVGGAGFSPDGTQVAVLDAGTESVELLDLRESTQRTLAPRCQWEGGTVTWSPDGRWLAVICVDGPDRFLSLLPTSGSQRYDRVAELPITVAKDVVWVGERQTYVERVDIERDSLVVQVGFGHLVAADARDVLGLSVPSPLRWSLRDSRVALVDRRGFLRGRRAGRTWLAVSAGGFRKDSVPVIVVSSTVDTLLYEQWNGGIDASIWGVVGAPSPVTVRVSADSAKRAFLSNGDHNWPSGVLSNADFSTIGGLTLEFEALFRFSGLHWQELEVALVPYRVATAAGERSVVARTAWWWVTGPSPAYSTRESACGVDYAGTVRADTIPLPESAWHRFVLQLRPDGVVECYLNGVFLGNVATGPDRVEEPVAVYLGGRTNQTRIYHGEVLLTRGLRY